MKLNKPFYISLAYLCLLLVGSLVFYRERMLFIDPAFITFEIINNKEFIFSEHRYGAFITQMVPLLGVYLKLPLKVILILYSASFYLFYIAVVAFCGFALKQKKLAILFVFYLTFIVTDVYFWPNNEVHQGVGWMILFLSLYAYVAKKQQVSPVMHIVLTGLLSLATISHLLVALPLLFLWFYLAIDNSELKKAIKLWSIYTLIIMLFIGLRLWLSYDSWYDGVKLTGIKQSSLSKIIDAFGNAQSVSMLGLLITKYWSLLIVLMIGFYSLLISKKYKLCLFTFLSLIGYYGLTVLTHSEAITPTNLFYFESQWMGLALIASTPFLFESIKSVKNERMIIIGFVILFIIKLPYLCGSLEKFQQRHAHLEQLVDQAFAKSVHKSYLYHSPELDDKLMQTWGLPVESMILSALDKENEITLKVFKKHEHISTSRDSIYTAFKFLPTTDLNPQYFNLSSEVGYVPLE